MKPSDFRRFLISYILILLVFRKVSVLYHTISVSATGMLDSQQFELPSENLRRSIENGS